ncbi:MAG: FkbM family methyltransferase [Solirubrobacteraceae bacterium]
MDLVGAFIWRVVGPVSPSLKARLLWPRSEDDAVKAVVADVVSPGDTVLDVGANIGLFTDHLARVVGPQGRVIAFEPHPAYARDLSRIADARKNVTLITAAVSDTPGSARLSVPEMTSGPNRTMGSLQPRPEASQGEVVDVPTTTLDEATASASGVRLLKIDVEGHEHEALLGGRGLLGRERPVVMLEAEQRHRQTPVAETFKLLRDLGYEGQMLTERGPRPLDEFDVERDQLALIASDPATARPPDGYVNNFVFTPAPR